MIEKNVNKKVNKQNSGKPTQNCKTKESDIVNKTQVETKVIDGINNDNNSNNNIILYNK